jgi:DNA-binding protein Fis
MKMNINDIVRQIDNIYFIENEGKVYRSLLDSLERQLLTKLMEYTSGNQLKAARILGINRNTLRSKIRKLGISR